MRLRVAHDLSVAWSAWDEMIDDASDNPFLRSWWLKHTVLGAPRIAVVRDNANEIVGGLALERVVRGVPQLRMIGEELGAADLDLVARPGHEAAVTEIIARWLQRRPPPMRYRLAGLRADAHVAALVPNGVRAVEGVATSEPTPTSLSGYVAARSANHRKDLRRTQRRILEEHGAQVLVLAPGEVDAALARFHELHRWTFTETSTLTPLRETFDRAVRAGLAAGEVTLHGLHHEGRLAAVEVMLTRGPRLGLLASAADRTDRRLAGAGNLLSLHAFEYAIEHGHREVDFLRGASAYKAHWVSSQREVHSVTGHRGEVARAVGALPSVARRVKRRLGR